MFNLRSGGQGASSPAQPPTIEAIRRRARHRLIGASVLVLAGVVGFSLLFDAQPRPVAVDVPIDIPAKQTTPPLALPAATKAPDVKVDGLDEREEAVAARAPTPAAAPTPAPAQAPSPVAAPTPKPAPAPAAERPPVAVAATPTPAPAAAKPAVTDASRAQALLDGKTTPAAAARVVVQVGAFAEQARAQEVRNKLERAGLKTYTHVAETAEGKRIRVRLGPYDSRADAEKAASKVKALGLPAAILTL